MKAEYTRQLAHIRRRMRDYPEHTGLMLAAAARIADLVRLGAWAEIRALS